MMLPLNLPPSSLTVSLIAGWSCNCAQLQWQSDPSPASMFRWSCLQALVRVGTIAENITPLVREAIPCRSSFRPQESIVFSGKVESLEACNCDEKRYRHKTAVVDRCRSAVAKPPAMDTADDCLRPSSGEVQDAGALCQW